ncbi:hypothetical protein C8F04DRAFT_1345415 [Mycena alexandri]|uniref:MULE transposase domain-containing protein n=1 Tax=Mycena alexandri TaxID=1745969 RepID=A0AAD6RW48_9AGAR|nr:hypothetical protein C8F04DRAFT_1345415 [Mycena alexandri]
MLLLTSLLPPRSRPKVEPETGPRRVIQSVPGSIRVGAVFDSFSDAESAIFANQEQHGHKGRFAANHYREPNPIHRIDIDPSDHRQGKSNRTSCMAHININRTGAKCHLTLVDIRHNHEPDIPPGGTAARPPTTEHLRVVSEFSDTFSRQHLKQISNMLNKSRREAREQVEVLGGDMRSILASLEEKGWDHSVQMDAENVVTALWWQSPEQKTLTLRYTDILINDNAANRNDKQYPLNTGIIIDSHGKSRNGWYALHQKEDAQTHADRHPSLLVAAAIVFIFTIHIFCLSHLLENIDRNLRGALGAEWQNFTRDFWAAYRAVSPDEFGHRWAWAWVSNIFTAGVRTNGRVETENRVNKVFGGPKKTLFQLFNALNTRTEQQTKDSLIRVRDHMLNTFENDEAYIGTRWLLRLVNEKGLVPQHLLKITHIRSGTAHVIAIF